MDYNYSIIIPHKNSPKLLQRCVDSIPKRGDIQIIIVDDNSDVDKKPLIHREGVEIILLDAINSKGAGRARNVGLNKAIGKWLLFADADDYYTEDFISVLDKYVYSDNDVIFFNAASAYSDTGLPANRTKTLNSIIDNFDYSDDSIIEIKYRTHMPWNKMVKHEFLNTNGIVFEDVIQGNDMMFSFLVGYFSRKIEVEKKKLYIYTYTYNSITTTKMSQIKHLCGWKNYYKKKYFLTFIGKKEWNLNLPLRLYHMYKSKELKETIRSLIVLIMNYLDIMKEKNKYVKICLQHEK